MSTDVTDQFPDINPGDLVFRAVDGTHVKVRTVNTSAAPDRLSFRVTGSWVDDDTGQAQPYGDGHFIAAPHDVTVQAETDVDLPAVLQAARDHVVIRVARAAANVRAAQDLSGVKPA